MGYCVNLDIADFFFGAYWHKIGKKNICFDGHMQWKLIGTAKLISKPVAEIDKCGWVGAVVGADSSVWSKV